MYSYGYPTYPTGQNNDSFGSWWVFIIIILIFFLFWGVGNNNGCPNRK